MGLGHYMASRCAKNTFNPASNVWTADAATTPVEFGDHQPYLWLDDGYGSASGDVKLWLENGDNWTCAGVALPVVPASTSVIATPTQLTVADCCFDSDPVGDGWGWNGSTRCQIVEVETPDEDCLVVVDGVSFWNFPGF